MGRPTRRFLHRAAIHVYHVLHPDYIPHKLTQRQMAEAMAYYQLEPWGPERDEIHAAMICHTVASQWSKRRITLDMFRLKFGPRSEKEKPQDLSDKLRSVAMAIGAKITKR